VVIPVASIFLFVNLLGAEDRWQDALLGTVAAAVAMVPDGLVLLTSLSFMAGIVALARRNALAKQLSTVEVLARVDVLCLDKTGTITTGEICFARRTPPKVAPTTRSATHSSPWLRPTVIPMPRWRRSRQRWERRRTWTLDRVEPFDSERKWSAASFVDRGWFYLGAPDFLLGDDDPARALVDGLSAGGKAAPGRGDVRRRSRRRPAADGTHGRSRSWSSRTRSGPTPPRSSPTSQRRTSRSR
jgi:cation-transporting P-type ATPase E